MGLARRRALRAYFLASKASVAIRGLLLADVLAYLLQLKSYRGHRVPAGPEMLSREVSLLSAQSGDRNGASPSETQSPTRLGAWAESQYICAHGLASGVLPESDTPSAWPARERSRPIGSGYGQKSPSVVVWVRTLRDTCSPIWNGLGSDKRLTLHPLFVVFIKPLGEDSTLPKTPGTVKPVLVSLVEPVACSFSQTLVHNGDGWRITTILPVANTQLK